MKESNFLANRNWHVHPSCEIPNGCPIILYIVLVIFALCFFCLLQQDFEKLRLTEEKLRTKTSEDSKTIEELADQLSKAKLEIDGLKALCNILPDFLFFQMMKNRILSLICSLHIVLFFILCWLIVSHFEIISTWLPII